ncbi:MAG: carotenoid biosynthesis protein [Acidobacteriota bacterium]|nr:carotenoid biosynthesis protein [Blastocatellia bacterium]MDW8413205.1 carotenoid biosynthesis protein [Acidobacteriota bacterium]
MPETLRLLWGTLTLRPYVFIFLAVYLFLAITTIGWKRTLLYSCIAYFIAFSCEWCSIRYGFPFGQYYYIPATIDKELWIAGVPFMDSLSFTFLSYVSYELAVLLRSPLRILRWEVRLISNEKLRRSYWTSLLAGLLMTYLDIIIDPVALQGERWFLGKIYYYPNEGDYFGVTIANFVGWYIVCVFIIRTYTFLESKLKADTAGILEYRFKPLGVVGLYFGILIFNLSMTFHIGEKTMGWAGVFITILLALLVIMHVSNCSRYFRGEQG